MAESTGATIPAAAFNCLWCGRPWTAGELDDLTRYAQLCSDCVGRAQDNEFLRFRLREGLKARAEVLKTAG